jgi:hypothetical protein
MSHATPSHPHVPAPCSQLVWVTHTPSAPSATVGAAATAFGGLSTPQLVAAAQVSHAMLAGPAQPEPPGALAALGIAARVSVGAAAGAADQVVCPRVVAAGGAVAGVGAGRQRLAAVAIGTLQKEHRVGEGGQVSLVCGGCLYHATRACCVYALCIDPWQNCFLPTMWSCFHEPYICQRC